MKKITIICSTLIIILAAVCFLILNVAGTSGVELYLDGKKICEVEKHDIAEAAVEALKNELSDNDMIAEFPEITYKLNVQIEHEYLDAEKCKQRIYEELLKDYVRGYSVICDGNLLCTVTLYSDAEKIVQRINEKVVEETVINEENCRIEVASTFEIKNMYIKPARVSSFEDAEKLLGIAKKSESNSKKRIESYSDDSSDTVVNTDVKHYSNGKISVELKRVYRYVSTDIIPFEIEYLNSKKIYVGSSEIKTEGANGISENVVEITEYADGTRNTQTISTKVIVEPVTQVEYIGIKKYPSTEPSGSYILPIKNRCTITTRYHDQPKGATFPHRGVDFACSSGTPVYAVDGGVVILAERSGTYGLMVRIQHGESILTYYGHLSKILVKAGDKVYKGQEIGKVGSTGLSTGPHLHFELLINKKTVDPELYLSIPAREETSQVEETK